MAAGTDGPDVVGLTGEPGEAGPTPRSGAAGPAPRSGVAGTPGEPETGGRSPADVAAGALARAFADEWGRVVATLIRLTGDWALAEDCAQDAFAAAATRWARDGVPDRPGAWLTTTARNAALDRLRRRAAEARAVQRVAAEPDADEPDPAQLVTDVDPEAGWPDDRLRLVFTCCHPALPLEARVALTLRTLCGLSVADIAAAFDVAEPAMAKRLVRARQKIAHARIPYRVPVGDELPERLGGVLAVVYLVFTEGYAPTSGDSVVRGELADQGIRLARALAQLVPGSPEVLGLLALVLLHDSRRAARAPRGVPVPLAEQDRSLWDADQLAEGLAVLDAARRAAALGSAQHRSAAPTEPPSGSAPPDVAGPYLIQAEIAAWHAMAPQAEPGDDPTTVGTPAVDRPATNGVLTTSDPVPGAGSPAKNPSRPTAAPARADAATRSAHELVALYDRLCLVAPTPHTWLARAVAIGRADGPDAGLAALSALHDELHDHPLLLAARADLLRRAGRPEALDAYREAIAAAPTPAQREFLEARLAVLAASLHAPSPPT